MTGRRKSTGGTPALAVGPDAGPPQRLVTRVVLEFLIDVLRASAKAHDGDLKAAVIFMAIQRANIDFVDNDPERAVRCFGAAPDDTLRRPITAHALSQSVSVPPETCRRYVQRLVAAGCCQRVGARGLISPGAVMRREPFASLIDETQAAFLKMLTSLRAINFDVVAAAAAHRGAAEPLVTLSAESMRFGLWAVTNGYVVRVVFEGVEDHERDFVRGLIFVTVLAMNVGHITQDPEMSWRYAQAASPPPDNLRIPVSVRAVSDRLGIPYETTRQHLIRMVEIGRAKRVEAGFIIPATVSLEPAFLRMGLNVYHWLLRTIDQLERLGIDVAAVSPPPALSHQT